MAEFPALPLWTDAYLADTSHLSDVEHGRYLLILIHLWRAPMQRFPNDDEWLARKFNRSLETFVSEWKPIMREFMHNDGNWWISRRMQKEFAYVKSRSAKNRVAANVRWNKEKGLCVSNAPTPTPIPLESKKEKRGFEAVTRVTVPDPSVRLGRFMNRLAASCGWEVVIAATDASSAQYARSVAICQDTARAIGKGWPHNWPTDGQFFSQKGKPNGRDPH